MTRKRGNNRRGAAAVEMALVLPFLMLMFVVAVDFARIFHVTQALHHSVYSGALVASGTSPTPTLPVSLLGRVKEAVCAAATGLPLPIDPDSVSMSGASDTVTVTVDYDFPLATGVLGSSGTVRLRRGMTLPVAPRPGD